MMSLRITEIFYSIQGESCLAGLPTVFIRLTGCPLRCRYCDTEYAFSGGEQLTIYNILSQVKSYNTNYVTVTGGEPLAQPQCLQLLSKLCESNYQVSLETSGALDVSLVDKRVVIVLDLKTPGSGEVSKNLYDNLQHINKKDQIKFVITNREDYEWSKNMLTQYDLVNKCDLLFSPSHGELSNQELADWILDDHLPVRFQLQMHKYVWGDVQGK